MTLFRKIKLISETVTGVDSIGQSIVTETSREVLVEVQSVNASEFFAGQQGGLAPEFRFRVDRFGYKDEKICEYGGKRYSIYKTYKSDNNYIDLYAEEERGTTNA